MSSPALQGRDRELLSVLASKVRLLSLSQIARTWWPQAKEAMAHRRLMALAQGGWIHLEARWARPELALTEPLAAWQMGSVPPRFDAVSALAVNRWTAPAVRTPCATATLAAGLRFGDRGGRSSREAEVTHDLHLARVYLLMRAEFPSRARTWLCEEVVASATGAGENVPDALVTDGLHQTAIEFVGEYPAEKLRGFHEYCAAKQLAYEFW